MKYIVSIKYPINSGRSYTVTADSAEDAIIKAFNKLTSEYKAEDIKKHKWFMYPSYTGIDYGIVCPTFRKFIVVNEQEIPKTILDTAEEIRLNT